MKRQFLCVALALAGLMAGEARANLVTNGGFETGDFTGWTANAVSFPIYVTSSPDPVNSGLYAAQIAGFAYGPDTLTQTIATTAGQAYDLSFARYQSNGGPVISLDVTWNGASVFSEFNTGFQPYQTFTVQVIGTGSDTLVFTDANDPGYTFLDDVSLDATATPEPGFYALLGLGVSGLAVMHRRKRLK